VEVARGNDWGVLGGRTCAQSGPMTAMVAAAVTPIKRCLIYSPMNSLPQPTKKMPHLFAPEKVQHRPIAPPGDTSDHRCRLEIDELALADHAAVAVHLALDLVLKHAACFG
jgi:hypothetical protein